MLSVVLPEAADRLAISLSDRQNWLRLPLLSTTQAAIMSSEQMEAVIGPNLIAFHPRPTKS